MSFIIVVGADGSHRTFFDEAVRQFEADAIDVLMAKQMADDVYRRIIRDTLRRLNRRKKQRRARCR